MKSTRLGTPDDPRDGVIEAFRAGTCMACGQRFEAGEPVRLVSQFQFEHELLRDLTGAGTFHPGAKSRTRQLLWGMLQFRHLSCERPEDRTAAPDVPLWYLRALADWPTATSATEVAEAMHDARRRTGAHPSCGVAQDLTDSPRRTPSRDARSA